MHFKPLFATIDLPDRRKIIIRQEMPVHLLMRLHDDSQSPGFSSADLKEYAEFDVSITIPMDGLKEFMIGLN